MRLIKTLWGVMIFHVVSIFVAMFAVKFGYIEDRYGFYLLLSWFPSAIVYILTMGYLSTGGGLSEQRK